MTNREFVRHLEDKPRASTSAARFADQLQGGLHERVERADAAILANMLLRESAPEVPGRRPRPELTDKQIADYIDRAFDRRTKGKSGAGKDDKGERFSRLGRLVEKALKRKRRRTSESTRAGRRPSRVAAKQLVECSGLDCTGVDGENPVIRGVKLLGEQSKNNRVYLPESVTPAHYEGRVINLNHPDGPNKQRRVEDRFGWIENAVKEGRDWRGDLHYNPKHPFAEQFKWLAKNKPTLIGLSHDAVGTGRTENGKFIVERVVEVKSVDLVADPAATNGLFESARAA